MSCPNAETTVAWVYGEAPEEHLHHVVACAECAAIVAEHERVMAAVSGVAPALRKAPARRAAWWALGGLALAAAALLSASVWQAPRTVADTDGPDLALAADPITPVTFPGDDVDAALDDLEADLDVLAADLDAL
jgi:hypothetical protein